MTVSCGDEHRSRAEALRDEGALGDAADCYTRAAYEYLGSTAFDGPYWRATCGLNAFLMGATCDRIATNPFRARNRCHQGILVASDVLDRDVGAHSEDTIPRRGAWFEYIGDFRTVGAIEHPDDAYRSARLLYRSHARDTSEAHERLDDYFAAVARAAGADPDRDGTLSLARRLAYKRERLSWLLNRLVERDAWPTAEE